MTPGVRIKNRTLLEQCAVILSILSFSLSIRRVCIYVQGAKKKESQFYSLPFRLAVASMY